MSWCATRKVGIVIGGGSGHEPLFLGFIGDQLNLDMAQELARSRGVRVETVRVWDDIKEERRGTSADVFVIKIAGAAAELGWDFDRVLR